MPATGARRGDVRDSRTRYAEGIPYVLVNGVVVVKKGEHTRARPGIALSIVNRSCEFPSPVASR